MPPLPDENRRRRNAPTIPTTQLSATGRRGRPPNLPEGYDLGEAGQAWWRWAWSLPQALAWSKGDRYALARRARLEDDAAAVRAAEGLDLATVLEIPANERTRAVQAILATLRALATGQLALDKERRELDDRFGLTAKGMAALRWKIVADPATEAPPQASSASRAGVASIADRRARLSGA